MPSAKMFLFALNVALCCTYAKIIFSSLLKITAEKLETSTQSRDTNRIAELTQELEGRKKVLERTTASSETLCNDWKTKLNPVWIVSGKVEAQACHWHRFCSGPYWFFPPRSMYGWFQENF